MRRLISLLILAVVVAMPASAQTQRRVKSLDFASDFQTIPVMANNRGVGAAPFQSYVALLNPTASPFTVTATLYDTTGVPREASMRPRARTWAA